MFAYLHTISNDDGNWRIFHAVTTNDDKDQGEVWLLYFDHGKPVALKEHHYNSRISAHYFVYEYEFDYMYRDIKEDWDRRHLYKEAYEDAVKIINHEQ